MRTWTTKVDDEVFHSATCGPLRACFQHTTRYIYTDVMVGHVYGVSFTHMRRGGKWCIGWSVLDWYLTIGDNGDGVEVDIDKDTYT